MAASLHACCRVALVYNRTNSCKSAALVLATFSRTYARGIKRIPLAVRTPEDDTERLKTKGVKIKDPRLNPSLTFVPGDPTQDLFTKSKSNHKSNQKQVKHGSQSSLDKPQGKVNKRQTNVFKSATKELMKNGLQYEKLEEGDRRFGRILMATKSRKEREKSGIILMEGRRLILDSLNAGVQLKYLYFSDVSLVASLPPHLLGGAELYKIQFRHLKLWADTHTPAGMLGVFAKPDVGEVMVPQQDTLPLTLICDNVRDPGNMGTIIRTAAAAGCRKVITTKGCVDAWDPKVLRGAMGGHFYTSILNSISWEQIVNFVSPSSYLCIADPRKDANVEKSFDISHPEVIKLLSTEDPEFSSSSDEETDADKKSETSEGAGLEEEIGSDFEDGDVHESVGGEWSRQKTETYRRVPLSVLEYSDMDLSGVEEVSVIVGGETEGVSPQAKKFAFERYGCFVTIPMVKAFDSLNTATAAAIVLYEARRQLSSQINRHHESFRSVHRR